MTKILSVDWGTSNFRIRLVDTYNGEILAELSGSDGIASVHNAWTASQVGRKNFYASILGRNIEALARMTSVTLDELPVIISGMASSTLGIVELPYAELPFKADGSSVGYDKVNVDGFNHDIWLISGIRSSRDVIRGEETQWIGLIQDEQFARTGDAIFIFPGTHSKHISVRSFEINDFKTYMTGEFFNLLSGFSVLKNSVTVEPSLQDLPDEKAFIEGVIAAGKSNLLHESFMVRTNDLFGRFNKKQNASYLSGLLVGSEVLQCEDKHIILAAGAGLSKLYALALQQANKSAKVTICSPRLLDESVVMGQLTIFKKIT